MELYFVRDILFLQRFNLFCGIIHGISAVLFLVIALVFMDKFFLSSLTTDFTVYDVITNLPKIVFSVISSYSTIWVLLPFEFVTALFHFGIACPKYYWTYLYNLKMLGINRLRWYEYSITAGLMIWVIFFQSGGTNLFLGLCLLALNAVMNLCGLLQEEMNATQLPIYKFSVWFRMLEDYFPKTTKIGSKQPNLFLTKVVIHEHSKYEKNVLGDIYNSDVSDKRILLSRYGSSAQIKKTNYSPFLVGCIPFLVSWGEVLAYFFTAVASNAKNVPWWIWTIDIGLFITFSQFAVIMILHYAQKDYAVKNVKKINVREKWGKKFSTFFAERENEEMLYQILSLTNKLLLVWILAIGSITR